MKKTILFTYITVFLISTASVSLAATKILRVAIDENYPPFSYRNDIGMLEGFDFDITNAICNELKISCEIVGIPFSKILESLINNKVDMAVSGMGPTPERKKQIDFSEPYYRSRSIFITSNDKLLNLKYKNIQDYKIGAEKSSLQLEYLQKNFKAENIFEAFSFVDLTNMLKENKLDTILVDGLPGYSFLLNKHGEGFDIIDLSIPSSELLSAACIGVRKGNEKLLEDINKSLTILYQSGKYAKINRKYFAFSIY